MMVSGNDRPVAVLIAGPTASGKSGLALALAQACDGVVLNADSMQVYGALRILTARPSEEDLRRAPHRLYGHVAPEAAYSVGEWAREMAWVLTDLSAEGRIPIICGGTGLYFRALLGGLDDMPAADPAVRARWRERLAAEGPEALHRVLAARDAAAAERIRPGDGQRIARALELVESTGRPLADLQRGARRPMLPAGRTVRLVLTPPRPTLRASIAGRFDQMVANGALAEARRFAARPGAMEGTAGKAIGVAELNRHDRGEIDLPEAVRLSVARSRQYAKRQDTWFRHQLDDGWERVEAVSPDVVRNLFERVKRG